MSSPAAKADSDAAISRSLLFVNSIKFWGGGEQWFLQCAAALRVRGYEVCVAGRRGGVFLDRIAAEGLPTMPLRFGSDFSPGDFLSLRTWIKDHAPVCVLCNFTRDVRVAGTAARSVPGTTVFWVMGMGLLRDRWRDRFWTRHCVDRFVVPSRSLAGELQSLGYIDPELINVLPIGLDLNLWPRPAGGDVHSGPRRPTVAVFARLITGKGHETLLTAWPLVRKAVPSARLWVCGTGDDEERLRALAVSLGGEVEFRGFVRDVRSVMAAADIVVQPSLREPFGIVLLEAMALCKAIVCTKVGGMVEVVDDQCAVVVPPSDPEALAHALIDLLNDPARAARMGEAGRSRLEEAFTLERMIDQLETLIRTPRA
jgi:glycosyltransferase involved in cell wall biosynthesis